MINEYINTDSDSLEESHEEITKSGDDESSKK